MLNGYDLTKLIMVGIIRAMKNTSNSTILESKYKSILEKVGLFPNEIKIYSFLLGNSSAKTGAIISGTRVGSSATYQSLNNLIDRGLVTYKVLNNIRYYSAETPDKLVDDLKEDVVLLEELSEIVKLAEESSVNRNTVNVFEGYYGLKRAVQSFVASVEQSEEIYILGYSQAYNTNLKYRNLFKDTDKEFFNKKVKVNAMLESASVSLFRKDRKDIPVYRLRTLPKKYFGLWAIDVSKKQVLLTILSDYPIAIIINEEKIVEGFRKNLEYMWSTAKEA